MQTNIVASYNPYDNGIGIKNVLSAIDRAIKDGFEYFDLLIPINTIKDNIENMEKFKKRKIKYFIHADYKINLTTKDEKIGSEKSIPHLQKHPAPNY